MKTLSKKEKRSQAIIVSGLFVITLALLLFIQLPGGVFGDQEKDAQSTVVTTQDENTVAKTSAASPEIRVVNPDREKDFSGDPGSRLVPLDGTAVTDTGQDEGMNKSDSLVVLWISLALTLFVIVLAVSAIRGMDKKS